MNRFRGLPLRELGAPLVGVVTLLLSLVPACRTSSLQSRDARADAFSARPALTLEQRRSIFVEAWKAIEEKHFDPAMNGVDWEAVRLRTAPKVDAARDDAEFLAALQEMIRTLGESHIGIGPPMEDDRKAHAQDGSGKGASQGTLGLRAGWVDGKFAATSVEPGSPADLAHVSAGDEILSVDGQPLAELFEALPALHGERWHGIVPYAFDEATSGSVGERLGIEVRPADGSAQHVELVHVAPRIPSFEFGLLGSMPVEFDARVYPGGALYLRFSPCIVDVQQRMEEALAEHMDAKGVVLDLRGNPGGVGAVAMGVARHFVDRPVELGTMRTRENPGLRFFVHPDSDPYRGPLVILVDGSTASTAEILAAGLQAIGRARLVGSTSLGMALPSVVVELSQGWRLQTVIADFRLPNGTAIEGHGVAPDVEVGRTIADLRERRDRALDAALAELPNAPTIRSISTRAEERILAAAPGGESAEASPETAAEMERLAAALHADHLAAKKSMRTRSHLSIMGMEGTIEQIRQAPDRTRLSAHNPLAGDLVQVYDGEHGWSSNAIQGLRELQGAELALLKRAARFDANVAWRELFRKVELLEPREVDGRQALVIRSTPRDGEGDPILTFLDPDTHLPFRTEFEFESEMGKVRMAIEMGDYKEFGGVLEATRTTTKVNGIEIVTTVDSVEWDVPVDDHSFDQPAKIERTKKSG